MKTHKHIFRLMLLVILAVVTMANAVAQTNTAHAFETTQLSAVGVTGDSYSWDLYNEVTGINFATVPGNCPADAAFFLQGINTGPSVKVTWLKPGTYFFKVTAYQTGCSNNIEIGKVEVLPGGPTAILAMSPLEICSGESASLKVAFTGNAPWSIRLQAKNKDGTTFQEYSGLGADKNPYEIPVNPKVTTGYTVVEITDLSGNSKDSSNTVSLTVNPLPRSSRIYLKNSIASAQEVYVPDKVCKGALRTYRINGEQNSTIRWKLANTTGDTIALSKPEGTPFTDVDKNGAPIYGSEIEVTWTMNPGTYTLKAAQSNGNRCETIETGTVDIVPPAIVFAGADRSICNGSSVILNEATASDYATLEWTTSGDGAFNFTSQLNPAYTPGIADLAAGTVKLTLKGVGLGNDGSCSNAVDDINIVINPIVKPALTAIGPLWQNSTAPALPGTSANGITGKWLPATINTANIATTTYTFTPDEGQCATKDSIRIVVNPMVTPVFDPMGPFCTTSTAPALPTVSANNITGTWYPAVINTSTAGTFRYTFTPNAGQGGIQKTMDIQIYPLVEPSFNLASELWVNAVPPQLPGTSINGITGKWDPDFIETTRPGINSFIFNPDAGQCAAVVTKQIEIKTVSTPTFNAMGPLCINSTPPKLPHTSINNITGTWVPDTILTSAEGLFHFKFTPNENQGSTSVSIDILVTPQFVPDFDSIAPLWQNSVAQALPTTSKNMIPGTWNPATIQTSVAGIRTYLFTPASGYCASTKTISILVKPLITAVFDAIGPYCLNIIPQPLPSVSKNGITGSWNPSQVNTSTVGTFPFIFTPDPGQGCLPVTTNIAIVPQITPTFSSIGPLWQNATPPVLPSVSTNGITGVWTPATIDTGTIGATTYSFRADYGQCAATATMEITVIPLGTPIFDPIGPLCNNSTPPKLPLISTNNIAGTWNQATINTSTIGTYRYTFNPTNSQGTLPVEIEIQILPLVAPVFDPIGPLVLNYSAPALPLKSINDITGTWTPSVINTAAIGKTDYLFKPDGGQCASSISMTIEVKSVGVPTFNTIGPFCLNSTPTALPAISNNGIVGTWTPTEISTSAIGTFRYTFTPEANQGSNPVTVDIQVVYQVSPTFSQLGPFWLNSTPQILPTTSLNGFTGTWDPAMVNTSTIGKTTYRFTPDAGQCATSTTMDITINQLGTPLFDPMGPFCQNSAPATLPVVSKNGIAGTWAPATVSTLSVGSFTFTFTPDPGQGSQQTTMEVAITQAVTPTFDPIGTVCQNSAGPTLPTHSLNGITGKWYPATINTAYAGTYTYNFTPDDNQCAKPIGVPITIIAQPTIVISPIAPLCSSSSAITLTATPAGGTFSGPGITGNTFNPASVGAGTYTITYTIPTDCGSSKKSAFILVNKESDAKITYPGSPFCPASSSADVSITGTTGGTFTSSPDGLSINASTGKITPSTSKTGIYLVTYTIAAWGGCNEFKTTASVEISSATLVISSPKDQIVTYPESAGFGVKAVGNNLTYQWQVNDGNGFTNISDSGVYTGALTDSLMLASPAASMNGYKYRLIVGGLCTPPDTSSEALLTVKIKPIDLIITLTAFDKVYDGNTQASILITDNHLPEDSIKVTYTQATFENKNVGTDKMVIVDGIKITGPDAQKYSFKSAITAKASITQKAITVAAVPDLKVYNGNTQSSKTPSIIPDLVENDASAFIQTYADKNIGAGKRLTPTGSVSDGNNGNNYLITFETIDFGIITSKPLIGIFTVSSKVYDGTTDAEILTRSLGGVISGESVNLVGGIASFDTPDAGTDKIVTGTGFILGGADINNYTVNDTAYTKADIFVKGLNTDLTVNKKTFTHYSDLVTLTATIQGGAALAGKVKAANTATFYVEGQLLTDPSNNSLIPVVVTGKDLVANITMSMIETTTTGILEAGTKEVKAFFSEENSNFSLSPNPARATLDFNPGFTLNVYPNPSPGPVSFRIAVDVGSQATLDLYTASGELISRVFDGYIGAGESRTIPFKAYLAQGIYRYRAIIGNEVKFGNVIIIAVY